MADRVPRDLLWRAWPDGHLPMRGARTVGGWLCFRARGPRLYLDPRGCTSYGFPFCMEAAEACEKGDLLPDLDPEGDPATWVCALRDLATALKWEDVGGMDLWWVGDGIKWSLCGRGRVILLPAHRERFPRCESHDFRFYEAFTDPAVALAAALATLR